MVEISALIEGEVRYFHLESEMAIKAFKKFASNHDIEILDIKPYNKEKKTEQNAGIMLVDYQKQTLDEIEKFNTKLRNENYFEITGFWNISELCKEIQIRIPAKRKMFAAFNGKFIILEEGQSITKDEIYKFITGKTEQENKDENEKWLKEKMEKDMEI